MNTSFGLIASATAAAGILSLPDERERKKLAAPTQSFYIVIVNQPNIVCNRHPLYTPKEEGLTFYI